MKKLLLLLIPTIGISSIVDSLHSHNEDVKEDVVYICDGTYAYAYHLTQNCRGLNIWNN